MRKTRAKLLAACNTLARQLAIEQNITGGAGGMTTHTLAQWVLI